MAIDIHKAISGNDIHNGSIIVGIGGRGSLTSIVDVYSSRAKTIPTIETIDEKYDGRVAYWKRYYTGDTDD